MLNLTIPLIKLVLEFYLRILIRKMVMRVLHHDFQQKHYVPLGHPLGLPLVPLHCFHNFLLDLLLHPIHVILLLFLNLWYTFLGERPLIDRIHDVVKATTVNSGCPCNFCLFSSEYGCERWVSSPLVPEPECGIMFFSTQMIVIMFFSTQVMVV